MQDDKKRLELAEQPLTPEEQHKIEVRVDKMMSMDPPEEEPVADTEKPAPGPKVIKAEKVVKKAGKPIVITDASDDVKAPDDVSEVAENTEPEAAVPVEEPEVARPKRTKISISEAPEEESVIAVQAAESTVEIEEKPGDTLFAEPLEEAKPETEAEPAEEAAPVIVRSHRKVIKPLSEITPAAAVETPQLVEVSDPAEVKPADITPKPMGPPAVTDIQPVRKQIPPRPHATPMPKPTAKPMDILAVREKVAALDKQDEEIAAAFKAVDPDREPFFKRLFAGLRHSKKARWALLAVPVLLLIAAIAMPVSRAWALNLVGVRGSVAVTVMDGSTQLPLQNVRVSVGSAAAQTDSHGVATVKGAKLGKQSVSIQKVAFAPITKTVDVHFGTTSLGKLSLQAAGNRYKLRALDYVTGKPITSVNAISGESNALADADGLITLTLPDANTPVRTITFTADGYRTDSPKLTLNAAQETVVQLVLDRPTVYFSKQSGKYDVYQADLDGKNKKVLLKGTGKETDRLTLVPHPTARQAAIVNTRDGTKDSDGYTLETLTLLNTSTGAPATIDRSERIIVVDWIGDRLVYVMAKAGASAANPSRYQLMSYDFRSKQKQELDHANAFNDIVSTGGSLYYATSNPYNGGVSQFVKVNPDGANKQVLLHNEIWNILRKDYNNFYLSTGGDNYTYKLGDTKPASTSTAYNSPSKLFIDSPDGKHSLWVDQRDGKGTVLVYDVAKQQDTVLAQQNGIAYPVRWVSNDMVIYRVKSATETADYVIGLNSNTAKKISDVTDALGRSLWYFY